jgi:uncharacterized protein YyaL (SSP411 family)
VQSNKKKSNRLINEKSPYLLQHAYNPVDWYPWGEAAFETAKLQNKPVFVSIGYSACHWCHVMEKESFNDKTVAKLMNEIFVCVKVDREERPDIDSAYMTVCQMMGRSCGWPLNIILTPNKNPFFAASYIPKNSRFGLVGMLDLVPQIEDIWKKHSSDLENLGEDIKRRIAVLEKRTLGEELGKDVLDDAYEKFVLSFDDENGGFGCAPKFPATHKFLFLLRYWKRTKKKTALAIVEKSLLAMRTGGIFDQVGFGFHRYSTDADWLVPHFEKMLYDQAMLALAYIETFQVTGAGKFKVTAQEVLDYVLRDLSSPEGGFYTAEDADSEGEEGKFYLWTEEEIRKTLAPDEAELAVKLFGIKPQGNYIDAEKRLNGKNILHLAKPLRQITSESKLTIDDLFLRLEKICNLLFKTREKRVHPAKDFKILADWNGLMIAALAKASFVLSKPQYLKAAIEAAGFILNKMKDKSGTLYHRYAKNERAIEGFLDDYAFLVWGLLEIYESTLKEPYLQAAIELTKTMISRFWDEEEGGFYLTAEGLNSTIARRKQIYDGALPSGNSVALLNMLRIALLTGDTKYEELANQTIKVFSEEVKSAPTGCAFALLGVDFAIGPTCNVILVDDQQEKNLQNMQNVLKTCYLPNMVVSLRQPSKRALGYETIEGKTTAYVCLGQICKPPTNKPEKMREYLGLT